MLSQDELEAELSAAAAVPATPPAVPLTALDSRVESVGDQQHCLVCFSDLTHPGILPCNHNEICGVCHLRIRHLHGNKKCPICKEEHEKIVVDTPGKEFDEYPMWGDELGSNYIFRKNVGMFFEHDHFYEVIQPLFGYQCTQPGCTFDGTVPDTTTTTEDEEGDAATSNDNGDGNQKQQKKKSKKPPTPLRALQDHLRVKHRLALCTLCVDHKRDFVARLPRMAPHQLKKHLTKGDPGTGFDGHPVCEFCRPKRFYDLTQLHLHLQKEHYKCHVCEKQGQHNQYFRNYQNLEKHFGKAHFLCRDPQCLQARFVVFENEIDLHAHERQVHGGTTSGSSKIQLEFRTRRTGYDGSGLQDQRQEVPSEEDFNYGLQGEAFVPAAAPQNQGPTLHPLHLQRTAEFRAHAAHIREQQELENQGTSFPTLQAATGGDEGAAGQQPINLGWSSSTTVQRVAGRNKNAGAVTETDFPALPSSAGPKSAASAKIRAGPPPASNRQFAAMRGAAARPVASAPGGGGGWGAQPAPAVAAASPMVAETPLSPYEYTRPAPPPAAIAPMHVNRAENLTQDNFPSLGPGTKKKPAPKFTVQAKKPAPKLAASGNQVKKHNKPPAPSWNSPADFPVEAETPPSPYEYTRPAPPPAAIAPMHVNRAENLTQDNFPSLGPATKKPAKYTVAGNLPKKHNKQPAPSWNSATDFPAPQASSAPKPAPAKPMAPAAPAPKKAPSLNSAMDFPPPPSAGNNGNSVKNRVMGNQKQPTQAAMANMLQVPQSSAASATNPEDVLNDIKTSIGQAKYKKLKKITKDFGGDQMAPDAFVDQAAGFFDRGYNDPDFWKTIPELVRSMPNQSTANQAMRFMEFKRGNQPKASAAASLKAPPPAAGNSWNAAPLDLTPESFPTPSVAAAPAAASGGWGGGPSLAAVASAKPTGTRYVVPSGKKNAWGAGTAPSNVVQSKKAVASVASAAANQGPQGGTATKFMAKQNKQQNHQQQQQQQQGKKKNKKKAKDELRDLAFGR